MTKNTMPKDAVATTETGTGTKASTIKTGGTGTKPSTNTTDSTNMDNSPENRDDTVATSVSTAKSSTPKRATHSFAKTRDALRYWVLLASGIIFSIATTILYMLWDNPAEFGTEEFWIIVQLRREAVITIIIVAFCQSLATLAFQTVTNNRILTPSIMGFEALYSLIHTSTMYFFGIAGFIAFTGNFAFITQVLLMVGMVILLYGWLLRGKLGSLRVMLLVGLILGAGLNSLASFMRRMLSPSEFDVLTARMFGSISNAKAEMFTFALIVAGIAGVLLIASSRKLNAITLGRDVAVNIGIRHTPLLMWCLTLIGFLMAVSTALVGPMTFFGFLVATLTYQAASTHDHRYLFPMAVTIGYAILMGSYFVMKNIFYAEGVVSIIIELVGGLAFLVVILRKGRL
ncbi:iron chelate uptake ABC transporter family permease subunit [Actinotignum urinale]|uniref:Iron chelate uptake ABC transporter family permease subunit n=1 Tax=Actinotignum urinale TaxID=190146 RepID=A0ABU5G9B4_9ACTO|nr:iron chelate uptake ABC transporter family permease subunit [Actinotignum urinale]MDY5132656.1 iron chelate uptake ABC transporter family permease subunit [Actinotignum urinale]WIK59536.1 iron chelate uptake ABC transporter family permease subunit [Actinotignum urinale]